MSSTTTLKDKVTYITITPTPSSPTSSIRTNSFESDREHRLDLPFHDNNEKSVELPSSHIAAFRQRRNHAVRRIRNIIVSIISLAVIFGLCSTGWWMRGVYDSYNAPAPLALNTTQNALEVAPFKSSEPISPSPETFPEVIAAATAAFEGPKGSKTIDMEEKLDVSIEDIIGEIEEKLPVDMEEKLPAVTNGLLLPVVAVEDVVEGDESMGWSEPIYEKQRRSLYMESE